ncbi:MAG: hypothetical protein PHC64_07050, partial [Candidatus Gastranaerophilales bacterium]|nr:hypothetical protein [Candidatus Gastranaerophilales bacterium]
PLDEPNVDLIMGDDSSYFLPHPIVREENFIKVRRAVLGNNVDVQDLNLITTTGGLKAGNDFKSRNINAGGPVILGDCSCVMRLLKTQGSLHAGNRVHLGTVNAKGDVKLGNNVAVWSGLSTEGSLTVGDNLTLGYLNIPDKKIIEKASINTKGDIKIGNKTRVTQSVITQGSLVAGDEFVTDFYVKSEGSVKLGKGAKVKIIKADSNIDIDDGLEVDQINTHGNIKLGKINELRQIYFLERFTEGEDSTPSLELTDVNSLLERREKLIQITLEDLSAGIKIIVPEDTGEDDLDRVKNKFNFFYIDKSIDPRGQWKQIQETELDEVVTVCKKAA